MSDAAQKRCVLFGCGGHASVLVDSLAASRDTVIVAVLDRDPSRWGTRFMNIDVIGNDDHVVSLVNGGVVYFLNGIGSVGDAKPRARMFSMALEAGLKPLTVRHSAAIVSEHAVLADGCQIFPGAIVNADATIGANAIVNTGAIVEHGCQVAEHAHIAPRAVLGGGTIVERGAHIGIGAVVREGIRIGSHAIVGAGAVVISHVSSNSVVKGVPAR